MDKLTRLGKHKVHTYGAGPAVLVNIVLHSWHCGTPMGYVPNHPDLENNTTQTLSGDQQTQSLTYCTFIAHCPVPTPLGCWLQQ